VDLERQEKGKFTLKDESITTSFVIKTAVLGDVRTLSL
jgi:hypothetical protein